MSKLIIKTAYIALVRRHYGEEPRVVDILAESKEDAMKQADELYFDVVWLRENGVSKAA